jgi:F-type H+-transporting ATPase subunit b
MKIGASFVFKKSGALALLGLLLTCTLCAQTPRPTDQSRTPAAQSVPSRSDGAEKDSGEAETAQFKHSASVKLLSRITGLSMDGAYWLAVGLNFAIVVGVIAWASKKNLPAIFRNRTATIQKSLEQARRASEDANRRLSDIESRLGRLDQEIAEMRAAGEKEAVAEEQRIKAATGEDARRVVESAQQEIAAAAKAARRDLTVFAADLAVSLAAKQIHVDGNTDRVLVRRFASQLSDDGSTGNKA